MSPHWCILSSHGPVSTVIPSYKVGEDRYWPWFATMAMPLSVCNIGTHNITCRLCSIELYVLKRYNIFVPFPKFYITSPCMFLFLFFCLPWYGTGIYFRNLVGKWIELEMLGILNVLSIFFLHVADEVKPRMMNPSFNQSFFPLPYISIACIIYFNGLILHFVLTIR